MEHTKFSHPQKQLPPQPKSVLEHETLEKGGRGREGGRVWEWEEDVGMG